MATFASMLLPDDAMFERVKNGDFDQGWYSALWLRRLLISEATLPRRWID